MKASKILLNGLIDENPTFRLVLGTCPTLATTTSAINGLGMGIAATFVLVGSNLAVAALKNFIPDKVRIPCFVVIIAAFVTIVQLMMKAFVPALDAALGIFIPLIVVNCIILARAEAFAFKNSVGASVLDGIGMGIGFTLALFVMGSIRELLGNGTILGLQVAWKSFEPMMVMTMAPGGFITFGLLIGIFNVVLEKIKTKRTDAKKA